MATERRMNYVESAGWCSPVRSDVVEAWSVHAGQQHQIALYDNGKLVMWSAQPFDNGIAVPVSAIEGLIAAHKSQLVPPTPEGGADGGE